MAQTLSTFKNTKPATGVVKYYIDSSSTSPAADYIDFITVSPNDCNGVSRLESVQALTSIKIGETLLNTKNGEKKTDGGGDIWYVYQLNPGFTGSLAASSGSCTFSELLPLPVLYDFRNSDYNAQFNNAIEIRRGYLTGSISTNTGGVFELDKQTGSLTPANLEAVMANTAITASFQESNIYSKTWTSTRYDGAKLDSGSLYYNDSALTFKKFEAVKFPLLVSSSFIRSQSFSDLVFQEFYFNNPFETIRPGTLTNNTDILINYHQGSIVDLPPVGQPVYELLGKEFKRVTKTKLYIPDENEVIAIDESEARYELKPTPSGSIPTTNNLFHVKMKTMKDLETIYYWNSSNVLSEVEIRKDTTEDLIISGTFVSSNEGYSLDAPGISPRVGNNSSLNHYSGQSILITQPWQAQADSGAPSHRNVDTYVFEINSSSAN